MFAFIGRYLIIFGVISGAATWAYYHVKGTGYAECKHEWDIANARAVIEGHNARAAGERDAADGVRDGHDRDE